MRFRCPFSFCFVSRLSFLIVRMWAVDRTLFDSTGYFVLTVKLIYKHTKVKSNKNEIKRNKNMRNFCLSREKIMFKNSAIYSCQCSVQCACSLRLFQCDYKIDERQSVRSMQILMWIKKSDSSMNFSFKSSCRFIHWFLN